eukprot:SAG11_NODE_394_length_9826_cov_3.333607_8_plen_99_part_00
MPQLLPSTEVTDRLDLGDDAHVLSTIKPHFTRDIASKARGILSLAGTLARKTSEILVSTTRTPSPLGLIVPHRKKHRYAVAAPFSIGSEAHVRQQRLF